MPDLWMGDKIINKKGYREGYDEDCGYGPPQGALCHSIHYTGKHTEVRKINKVLNRRILRFVGSKNFFWGIVGLLVLQAVWIAFSGRYPMAFDEDFHLGIINLYAHHISPFWNGHPAGADSFGAVTRDPSYLYHYLMSFLYRLLSAVTDSQFAHVMLLRLINTGLFAAGLVLYRRLLLKSGASQAVVNFCLLIIVLVPVTPLLAAQINYDNLFLPVTAIVLLLTLKFDRSLGRRSFDIKSLGLLIITCLFASLVKYAFLPIFVATVVYLLARCWRAYSKLSALEAALKAGLRSLSQGSIVALSIGLIVAGGLFVERYGVNLLLYHKPVADCAEVLNYEHCQYYGPWIRDYDFEANKGQTDSNPVLYTQHWIYGLWFRSFFSVDGPASQFQTKGPLWIPSVSVIAFASLAGIAFVITCRRLWRKYNGAVLWLFSAVSVIYLGSLWLEDYRLFVKTAHPVAINGRYLLVILPFIILLAVLAVKEVLHAYRLQRFKIVLATVVIICFAWGGGAMTYVLRSQDSWYWPNTPLKPANDALQRALGPVTPGYHNPTLFLH